MENITIMSIYFPFINVTNIYWKVALIIKHSKFNVNQGPYTILDLHYLT